MNNICIPSEMVDQIREAGDIRPAGCNPDEEVPGTDPEEEGRNANEIERATTANNQAGRLPPAMNIPSPDNVMERMRNANMAFDMESIVIEETQVKGEEGNHLQERTRTTDLRNGLEMQTGYCDTLTWDGNFVAHERDHLHSTSERLEKGTMTSKDWILEKESLLVDSTSDWLLWSAMENANRGLSLKARIEQKRRSAVWRKLRFLIEREMDVPSPETLAGNLFHGDPEAQGNIEEVEIASAIIEQQAKSSKHHSTNGEYQ